MADTIPGGRYRGMDGKLHDAYGKLIEEAAPSEAMQAAPAETSVSTPETDAPIDGRGYAIDPGEAAQAGRAPRQKRSRKA